MKRDKKAGTITKIAAAGALLAFQAIPESLSAQKPVVQAESANQSKVNKRPDFFLKFANTKLAEQKLTVVALLNGEPVVKLGTNELYQMNTQTGDVRLVKTEEYNKLSSCAKGREGKKIYSTKERPFKVEGVKQSYKCSDNDFYTKNQIQLLGVDKDGHEIFQNTEKEKFYFDPATGDMVDFDGHIATLK